MPDLFALFAPTNFSLIALILGMPLLGAFINGVWGKRLGREAVRTMALAAMAVSFFAAVFSFASLDHLVNASKTVTTGEHGEVVKFAHAKLSWTAWQWMTISGPREAAIPLDLKFSIDALSGIMLLVVTGVGFLIHLYASSYMEKDKGYYRFFCYLNLFVFSMLVLILADNLPVLFVGWEGVGLCSYLLIGFWFDKTENAAAGKKAFIANRVGDFGLIVGMFLLVYYTGALDWQGIENGATSLVTTNEAARVHLWPIGGGQFTGFLSFLQPKHAITISAATAVSIMLFLGCTGKSAQLPLYVWLPDAMAGPTPVSALIHAATMVTAGVYLVCRLNFVFVLAPGVMMIIAIVGATTALFAATIALVQNDIKKVLAYSTVSQLGFMFLGVGVGAFTAGFFHVFTHAFFKACLFLGAGSVIHAMHARIHDDVKSQDMRFMGGLKKYMPATYWTFLVATLAIIGFPFTSGFFSKDEILFKAFVNHQVHPMAERVVTASKGRLHLYQPPEWVGPVLYGMGVLAATLTAFYMSRAFILTFLGKFRGWEIGRPSLLTKATHGHDDHDGDHGDDEHHHEEDLTTPGHAPHESPWQMTVPLIVLATFAAGAGLLNPGLLKAIFHLKELPMDHWLEPVFGEAVRVGVKENPNAHHLEFPLAAGASAAFIVGTGIAYWMYIMSKGEPAKRMAEAQPALHQLLLDKWRVDEFYNATVINGVDALSDTAASVDSSIIDGVLGRLSALIVAALGTILRAFQNGVVHVYAAFMVVGLSAFSYFFIVPHPDATVRQSDTGDFAIEAAPGLGYGYRWYPEAGGKPTNEVFTGETTFKLHLEPEKKQTVRLEVRNAFGLARSADYVIERPKAEKPSQPMQLGQN